ncbi:unnamed protein product [Phytophthora lilii]|uniref:Unnamed protein product n=1 Tax=Phytophthora lilii TaxID=2077276 RepID=A0A9W6TE00_9STRA|nr:unnamed protein product [Phytophthora lilii]
MQTLEGRKAVEKERHRQNMACKRATEKATLCARRSQLAALLLQQQELLAAYWDLQHGLQPQQQSSISIPTAVGESFTSKGKANSETKLYLDKYVSAVELGNAIRIENAELKKRLDEYEKFESLLHRDTILLADANCNPVRRTDPKTCWQKFSDDEELFYYEPVDSAECYNLSCKAYPLFWSHHAQFMQVQNTIQDTRFLGWDVQTRADNRRHHFHFSKPIPCTNGALVAQLVGDEAWHTFHTLELYERLYSTPVALHILQRVDPNTSVALQSLPAANTAVSRRCLTLASRIVSKDEEGCQTVVILLLGMPPREDMARRNANTVEFVQDTSAYLLLHQRVDGCETARATLDRNTGCVDSFVTFGLPCRPAEPAAGGQISCAVHRIGTCIGLFRPLEPAPGLPSGLNAALISLTNLSSLSFPDFAESRDLQVPRSSQWALGPGKTFVAKVLNRSPFRPPSSSSLSSIVRWVSSDEDSRDLLAPRFAPQMRHPNPHLASAYKPQVKWRPQNAV